MMFGTIIMHLVSILMIIEDYRGLKIAAHPETVRFTENHGLR